MCTCKGGQKVEKGTYWDVWSGRRVDVSQEDVLPGGHESKYLKMQPSVMLLLGLVTGAFYAFSFPFIAIAGMLTTVGRRLLERVIWLVGTSMSMDWRPKNAYLAGKKRRSEREKSDKSALMHHWKQEKM